MWKKTGVLSNNGMGKLQFQYDSSAKHPLSVRMPIRTIIYDEPYAEPFFGNLTPEGDALHTIAKEFHTSDENTFSILDKIGGECAGDVSLYEGDIPDDSNEKPVILDEKSMAEIIEQYDPYQNEWMNSLISGGASGLLVLSKSKGMNIDYSKCYSVCDLCHMINRELAKS